MLIRLRCTGGGRLPRLERSELASKGQFRSKRARRSWDPDNGCPRLANIAQQRCNGCLYANGRDDRRLRYVLGSFSDTDVKAGSSDLYHTPRSIDYNITQCSYASIAAAAATFTYVDQTLANLRETNDALNGARCVLERA